MLACRGRSRHLSMQVPYLGLSVGHRHLCDGGAVEDGPEAALVLVGDVVDDKALTPGEANADVPPLPLDQVALHLRKPCLPQPAVHAVHIPSGGMQGLPQC